MHMTKKKKHDDDDDGDDGDDDGVDGDDDGDDGDDGDDDADDADDADADADDDAAGDDDDDDIWPQTAMKIMMLRRVPKRCLRPRSRATLLNAFQSEGPTVPQYDSMVSILVNGVYSCEWIWTQASWTRIK